MQQQLELIRKEDQEYVEWSTKHDQAAEYLRKIAPSQVPTKPALSTHAWSLVFPNESTRDCIGRYLGQRKGFFSNFEPAKLTREDLANPVVQQAIQEVLDVVEGFKKEHPDWARSIKLLPPS